MSGWRLLGWWHFQLSLCYVAYDCTPLLISRIVCHLSLVDVQVPVFPPQHSLSYANKRERSLIMLEDRSDEGEVIRLVALRISFQESFMLDE